MTSAAIADAIIGILSSREQMSLQLEVGAIGPETSLLADLALDSIQLLELLVAIEQQFQIRIRSEDLNLEIFDRFSLLVSFIEERLASRGQSS